MKNKRKKRYAMQTSPRMEGKKPGKEAFIRVDEERMIIRGELLRLGFSFFLARYPRHPTGKEEKT